MTLSLPSLKPFRMPLCALFLIFMIAACSQKRQTDCIKAPALISINIVDRNGLTENVNNPERMEKYASVDFLRPQPYQKVLRLYSRDPQGNIPAIITSYHPNGYPWRYLEVVNSRAYGQFKEWYPNGNLRISAFVIEGTGDIIDGAEKSWVFDGCSEAWTENGELEATIPYVKGVLEGISTYYHPSGSVWKTIPYVMGAAQGSVEIYRCEGGLLQTTNYCNGVKEGESRRYWPEDKLAAEEIYSEGLLISGRYYDCGGECIAKIEQGSGKRAIFAKDYVVELQEFRCGVLEGEVKILDRSGRVINLYHAKNSSKHGEEICYHESGRFQQTQTPKMSMNWYEGKIQGIARTWYDNGTQESQKEMSNNKKNGHSTAWYRDGSLMLIEEYEQDKLLKGEYFNRGEKYPVTTIVDGKGTATLFDPEGNFIRKIEYKNGKPVLEE